MKEKWVGLFAIICILLYIGSIAILGSMNNNYDHTVNLISELGKPNMKYNFILNTTLVFSGISLITMAYYLKRALPKSRARKVGVISLGLFGLSVISGGLFPCEIDCMNPTTTSGYLHAYLGLPTNITSPLSFIALSRSMKTSQQFQPLSNISLWLGILSCITLATSFTLFPELNLIGLGQRVAVFFQLSVPFLISIKILKNNESLSV